MQKYSEKEYEYLKKEVSEVKAGINRYIGYAISVSGITTVIVKYLINRSTVQNSSLSQAEPLSLGIILSAIIVVTFLFEIIWYKFKSHNRYVGYTQLILQEVGYTHLSGIYNIKELKKENIISWEFVMARFNNVVNKKDIALISESIGKLRFELSKPKSRDINKLKDYKDIESLQKEYLRTCIYPQFIDQRKWYEKVISKLFIIPFLNFFLLWYKPLRRSVRCKIDRNYLSISWAYPKKILQIAFLLFIGLSLLFFYIFFENYKIDLFKISIAKEYIILLPSWSFTNVLMLIWLSTFLVWIYKYLSGLQDLTSGRYSVEHFCWIFFIYRIQVLNANKIKPIIFSRGYRRFVKSRFILQYIKEQPVNGNHGKWEELNNLFHNVKKISLTKYIKKLETCEDFKGMYVTQHEQIKAWSNEKYYNK